jgi:hypothetical protein
MEVTTLYREILPNVALFDEIQSKQPLGVLTKGGNRIESHESQKLLSFRFLIISPPGVTGHKWIAVGSTTADSLANLDTLKSVGRRPVLGPKQDQPPSSPQNSPGNPPPGSLAPMVPDSVSVRRSKHLM